MTTEPIPAYPLAWPSSWRRTPEHHRTRARFNTKGRTFNHDRTASWQTAQQVTIAQALECVLDELERLGVPSRQDVVVSTNLQLRLDGLPRSGQREPEDPGVCVYWKRPQEPPRCMAVDRYDRVADNLAAIAATLEALRAIERHGGATILDRAFTGFVALPAPEQWFQVLGVPATATREQISAAYRRLAAQHHPDRPGGSDEAMARLNTARDDGLAQARA
jgi:hypothetical protein